MKKVKRNIRGYSYKRSGKIVRVPPHRRTYNMRVNRGAAFGAPAIFGEGREIQAEIQQQIALDRLRDEEAVAQRRDARAQAKRRVQTARSLAETENLEAEGYTGPLDKAYQTIAKPTAKAVYEFSKEKAKKGWDLGKTKLERERAIRDLAEQRRDEEIDETFKWQEKGEYFQPTEARKKELLKEKMKDVRQEFKISERELAEADRIKARNERLRPSESVIDKEFSFSTEVKVDQPSSIPDTVSEKPKKTRRKKKEADILTNM